MSRDKLFDDMCWSVFAKPCTCKHARCNATLSVLGTEKWQVHCQWFPKFSMVSLGIFSHLQIDLMPINFAHYSHFFQSLVLVSYAYLVEAKRMHQSHKGVQLIMVFCIFYSCSGSSQPQSGVVALVERSKI